MRGSGGATAERGDRGPFLCVPTPEEVSARTVAMFTVAGFAALAGAVLLIVGMANLREAHLYRQATGEGLKFAGVGAAVLAGSVLVSAAVGLLVVAARRLADRSARVLRAVAVALVVPVAGCVVLTIWVHGHSGCVGSCG